MPTGSQSFFSALEAVMNTTLPQKIKTVLGLEGYDDRWCDARSEQDRAAVLAQASRLAENIQVADSTETPRRHSKVSNPRTRKVADDQRWPLWRDLMRVRMAADGMPPEAAWEPLRFFLVDDHSMLPLRNRRVEISFDWRMPRAALEFELVRAWSHMTAQGWVRPGKPLSPHLAELVRFNCLVLQPGTPWRERWQRWNAQCAEMAHYDDVRQFERAFRRAEMQLTGHKWGLAWFYEDVVRSGRLRRLGSPDGEHLLRQGPRRLTEMYRELYDPSFRQPPEWFDKVYEDMEREDRDPDYRPIHWAKRMDARAMRYEQDWGTQE